MQKNLIMQTVANFRLLQAIGDDNLEAVTICIAAENADIDFLMVYNEKDQTPLMFAARKGRLEIARYLVASGAELDKTREAGFTAIHIAAQEGQLDVLRFLSEQGADKEKSMNDGTSPLWDGSSRGSFIRGPVFTGARSRQGEGR